MLRIICLTIVSLCSSNVFAQNLTVQQPVVSNFRTNTTVVVPDRGGAFLGSVSRSAMTRSDYGPLNLSRPIGKEQSHLGQSVHVYIHDFDAMDHALLQKAKRLPRNSRNGRPPLTLSSYSSRTPRSSSYRVIGMSQRYQSISTWGRYATQLPKRSFVSASYPPDQINHPPRRNRSDSLSLDELERSLRAHSH